jgi:hypothetical protein
MSFTIISWMLAAIGVALFAVNLPLEVSSLDVPGIYTRISGNFKDIIQLQAGGRFKQDLYYYERHVISAEGAWEFRSSEESPTIGECNSGFYRGKNIFFKDMLSYASQDELFYLSQNKRSEVLNFNGQFKITNIDDCLAIEKYALVTLMARGDNAYYKN